MLKIGIVGMDKTALRHLRMMAGTGFTTTGIFAPQQPEARALCRKMNIRYFSDFNDLLQQSDAIDLASPLPEYYPLAAQTIRKSGHLFIENAVLPSPEEALRLIKLTGEARVIVQVNYPERHHPAYQAALPYISGPLYIEAQRHIAFTDQNKDLPVVMDLMMHDIDIVLSLAKANIRKVHATGVKVFNGTPDIVNANLEFDNGVVANLTANRIASKNIHRIKIYQRHARIQADFLKNRVKILRQKVSSAESPFVAEIKEPEAIPEDKLTLALTRFYNNIKHQKTPAVGLEDAYQNLKAAFLINDKIELLSRQ